MVKARLVARATMFGLIAAMRGFNLAPLANAAAFTSAAAAYGTTSTDPFIAAGACGAAGLLLGALALAWGGGAVPRRTYLCGSVLASALMLWTTAVSAETMTGPPALMVLWGSAFLWCFFIALTFSAEYGALAEQNRRGAVAGRFNTWVQTAETIGMVVLGSALGGLADRHFTWMFIVLSVLATLQVLPMAFGAMPDAVRPNPNRVALWTLVREPAVAKVMVAGAAMAFAISVVATLAIDEVPTLGLPISPFLLAFGYNMVRAIVSVVGLRWGARIDADAAGETGPWMAALFFALLVSVTGMFLVGISGLVVLVAAVLIAELGVYVLNSALKTQLVKDRTDEVRKLLLFVVARSGGMAGALLVVTVVLKGIPDRPLATSIAVGISVAVLICGMTAVFAPHTRRAKTSLAFCAAETEDGEYAFAVIPIAYRCDGQTRICFVLDAPPWGRGYSVLAGDRATLNAYLPDPGSPGVLTRVTLAEFGFGLARAKRMGSRRGGQPRRGRLFDHRGVYLGRYRTRHDRFTVVATREVLGPERLALLHPDARRGVEEREMQILEALGESDPKGFARRLPQLEHATLDAQTPVLLYRFKARSARPGLRPATSYALQLDVHVGIGRPQRGGKGRQITSEASRYADLHPDRANPATASALAWLARSGAP